jgi:UDPglucose--hexose-1-phosphate uridylyltransferase
MADLRRNSITGHSVIIAENRGTRPREVSLEPVVRDHGPCPFCEGNEHLTPGELLATRAAGLAHDRPGWRVRVIPNKYPAITDASAEQIAGLFAHEVIIESPRHLTNTTELDQAEFTEVLDVYRERISHLGASHPHACVTIFKNNGPAAGATLSHLHSQLVVLQCPLAPREEMHLAERDAYFEPNRRLLSFRAAQCPACEMIADAETNNRVVSSSTNYVVLCPHASRLCYEMWLVPRSHAAHYSRVNRETLPELASLFRAALVKLERIVKVPAYNYIVHTAPFDTSDTVHYHWHIEILPRITTLAGFELGTGCYINPVSPERAAGELRQA